jgi:hypothetical protein
VAVEWLPLAMAIRQLSYPLEKLFLNNVGHAISRRRKVARMPPKQSCGGGARQTKRA